MGKYKEWKESFQMKKKYSKNHPYCFYDLVEEYLPEDKNAIIIDVGCGGMCLLEKHLKLDKYNLFLLDGNKDTIDILRMEYKHTKVIKYWAPDRLPIDDKSVDFIYCGHMIEHLIPTNVYSLLVEYDRILKSNGILIISSPMLWIDFYNDLDHIRPYQPAMFEFYLCNKEVGALTYTPVSKDYVIEELVYRYDTFLSDSDRMGSSNKIVDFLIQGAGRISRRLGLRRYMRSGYMIILRKKI